LVIADRVVTAITENILAANRMVEMELILPEPLNLKMHVANGTMGLF
jgi:hypothetical protein